MISSWVSETTLYIGYQDQRKRSWHVHATFGKLTPNWHYSKEAEAQPDGPWGWLHLQDYDRWIAPSRSTSKPW